MIIDPVIDAANPETRMNYALVTLESGAVYGKRPSTTTGLTWGYYGGRWGGFAQSNDTFALTDNSANYNVVARATGVPTMSASASNWNDALNYGRVYKLTTAGGVVTAEEDHREGAGGIFGPLSAGAGTEIRGLTFTSDTGSTADSDPGNGLFKWNNATQASATVLYFDNQTADGVSLTTLWASLAGAGFIYLQQADDASKWQEWKWTAAPVDGTGYRKFTVTLQANGGAIADAKTVLCDFESDAGSDTHPYDIGGSYSGAPTASVVLMRYPLPRAVTFPAGLAPSQGVAAVAATAQTDFDILKNGSSFGTMRFAAAGTVASFIAASPATFAAGDILTVVAPASPDATLADIGFALSGTR